MLLLMDLLNHNCYLAGGEDKADELALIKLFLFSWLCASLSVLHCSTEVSDKAGADL